MAWHRIEPARHRIMPWRNGAGSTAEIAIGPTGASIAGRFDWRLSLATVAQDGPFSAFPGYDRVIALLAGPGMELELDGGERHRLDRPFAPFAFAGERAVRCRLLGGTCEDLNLMVARDRLVHETTVLGPGGAWSMDPAREATRLLFLFRGSAMADGRVAIAPRDTVVVGPGEDAPRIVAAPAALALLAVLAPRAGPDQAAVR